jgi:hypothetical protein
MDGDHDFCSGPGRVMLPGFQSSKGGNCVLYLFQGAVVDSAAKYALAVVGTLLLGLALELIRFWRTRAARYVASWTTKTLVQDAASGLIYGVQMVIAYWLMLLVMLYGSGLFLSVIVGLAIGHCITAQLQRHNAACAEAWALLPASSTSPCCGEGADNAESRV